MKQRIRLKKHEKHILFATMILMVSFLVVSIVYVACTYSYTREASLKNLRNATETTKDSLEEQFRMDRTLLRQIAKGISESGKSLHSLEVGRYLNNYDINSLISKIGILTPENQVVRASGMDLDASGIMDFQMLLPKGEHISSLMPDLENPAKLVIRDFVPIRRDGETIGLLFGATTPEAVLNTWIPEVYEGHADVSVVDQKTGRFLIDSYGHENESVSDYPMLVSQISVDEELSSAFCSGRAGFAVGRVPATAEEFYFCFLPLDLAPWEMVISLPTENVYSTVRPVQLWLYIFIAAEAAGIILFFLFVLFSVRKAGQKPEQKEEITEEEDQQE